MADITVSILVADEAVRALKVYTNDGTAVQMKAALEQLIREWGTKYLTDSLTDRLLSLRDAIGTDEDKLAAAESAVGL